MIHTTYLFKYFKHAHRFFFYLTILLLPTQLGYHWWPQWATILGRRVDYLAPTVYVTDIFVLGTIVSWVFSELYYVACSRYFGKNMIKVKFRILHTIFYLLLIGIMIINIIMSVNPLISVYKWVKVLEYCLFGLYILKTKPKYHYIIYCLSGAVLYSSIIAIIQFTLQHSIGGIFWWLGERTFTINTPGIARIQGLGLWGLGHEILRAYGTFPHPNVLGGFLAAVLPLLIHLQIYKFTNLQINRNMNKIINAIVTISICFGIITLFITFSRSAWVVGGIGLIICSMYYVVCSRGTREINKLKNIIKIFISFVVIIGIVFIFQNTYYTLHTTDFFQSESFTVRQDLNISATKMISHFPFFGVGLGNYITTLPSYLVSRQVYFLQPVHNIYFLMVSEIGVVGVCLLIVAVIIILNSELRIMNRENKPENDYRTYKFPILYSLFSILVIGLVDHYPLTLQQGQLLTTLIVTINLIQLYKS